MSKCDFNKVALHFIRKETFLVYENSKAIDN